jgi:hypothetical protein
MGVDEGVGVTLGAGLYVTVMEAPFGSTMTRVVSATLLVTVTVTVTMPPAGRDPAPGETLTVPALPATWTVNCGTGPLTAVSSKDPLTVFPAFEVSDS